MNEFFRTILMLPPQASSVAYQIDVLHYVVISVSVLGATAVAVATAAFLLRFRSGAPHHRRQGAAPARVVRVPFWTEVVAIGGLLSMFVAFWWVGFRQYMHLYTPPDDAIEIYVIGKQWMWEFAYADGTVSNGDLHVPVGQPVKLSMTSRDVIHSFYVPSFRVKQDVVPGRMTTMWFEATQAGEWDLLCAEYCGAYHSAMRGRVIALAPDDYARWAERGAAPALAGDQLDLAAVGARVANDRGCLRCHTVDGTPHIGPTWAGLFGSPVPLASAETVLADEAYLTESMMDPAARLRLGFAPVMPSYLGQLTATETAALVEYIRSLRVVPVDLRRAPLPLGGAL